MPSPVVAEANVTGETLHLNLKLEEEKKKNIDKSV